MSDVKPAPCSGCGTTFGIYEGKCPVCWKASYDAEKARADREQRRAEHSHALNQKLSEGRSQLGQQLARANKRAAALEALGRQLLEVASEIVDLAIDAELFEAPGLVAHRWNHIAVKFKEALDDE